MPHSTKRRAYLVAVLQKRRTLDVYAVLASTSDEALEVVALNVPPEVRLEIVGGLSRELVKRLRLVLGEPALI
jgi:ATP-dependent 26S proteasome regulatory subunit